MDNCAKSCFRIDPMKSEFAYWHDFRQGFQASNVCGEKTKDNEYSCTFAEARAKAKRMKDEADTAGGYNQPKALAHKRGRRKGCANSRKTPGVSDCFLDAP